MNKKPLLAQITIVQESLDHVAREDHEIGNLCNAVNQLADVLKELVNEVSENKAETEMLNAVVGRML